jgi:hypothetical protein
MQAPAAGCTGRAPPPLPPVMGSGDGGAGTTLDEGLVAVVSASPAPATPNPIATTRAAPPQTTAAVLRLRVVTAPNCSFSSRDAQNATARI